MRTIKHILVVEDQKIIAKDIQESLHNLGYSVSNVVSSGEDAIQKAEETVPDLVLMDIVLKGKMSGLEAAQQIRERFDIPVVYLTAYADEQTFQNAKLTEPFGYVIKPFKDEELKIAVEMAIYKHRLEKKLRENVRWLNSTLRSMGDAVIIADADARIKFINPVAEAFTGFKRKDALGKGVDEVLKLIDVKTLKQTEDIVTKSLRDGVYFDFTNYVLVTKEGKKITISESVSPIKDEEGDISGAIIIFRSVTNRKHRVSEEAKAEKYRSITKTEFLPIRLVVASPSTLVREGIRKILELESDIEIVAEASNLVEILLIIEQKSHDVLFIDTSLPDLDLIKIQEMINKNKLDTKMLLLLHDFNEEFIISALYLGIHGYIRSTTNPVQYIQAIRTIVREEMWAERDILSKLLMSILGSRRNNLGLLTSTLTLREREIIKLLSNGLSNKQISQKLSISKNTVKNHLSNIFHKLGISKRIQIGLDLTSKDFLQQ